MNYIRLGSTFSVADNQISVFGCNVGRASLRECLAKSRVSVYPRQGTSYVTHYCRKTGLALFGGTSRRLSAIDSRSDKHVYCTDSFENSMCFCICSAGERGRYYLGFVDGRVHRFDIRARAFKTVARMGSSVLCLYLSSALFVGTRDKQTVYVLDKEAMADVGNEQVIGG